MKILLYIGVFILGELTFRLLLGLGRYIYYRRQERIVQRWANGLIVLCVTIGENDMEMYDFSKWDEKGIIYVSVELGKESSRYLPPSVYQMIKESKDGLIGVRKGMNVVKTSKGRFLLESWQ